MTEVNLYALASRHAQWIEARQSVASRNIANVNTPDFQPREVVPFDQLLNRPTSAIRTSHPLHFDTGAASETGAAATRVRTDDFGRVMRADIQGEMMHASGIRSAYELNTAIVKTFNRLFLTVTRSA